MSTSGATREGVAQQLTNLIKQIEALVMEHQIQFEVPGAVCRVDYDTDKPVWTSSVGCSDYVTTFNEVRNTSEGWREYYSALK